MLIRDDYLKLIEEIRNLEKGSLDEYINKKLISLKIENEFFIETLYKDILYVLRDVDDPGDSDLVVEDGDFAIENGDFKVSGYETNLHRLEIWLHMQMTEKIMGQCPFRFVELMQHFENSVLEKDTYTVEYRKKLDEINRSIKKERNENYDKIKPNKRFFSKLFDTDNWKMKIKIPIIGLEINFSGIIRNFQSKNKSRKV